MPPNAFPLILLRHGQSRIPTGTCVGQLDVQLTDPGRLSIQELAANWPCDLPQRIFCSDLRRTAETADIVAKAMALPSYPDARLRELDFGDWEGKRWSEIHAQDAEFMDTWGSDWMNTAPPGGENVGELSRRVIQCFEEICRMPSQPTLIVAHAGSLRALMCHLKKQPLEKLFDREFQHGVPVSWI